MALVNAVRNSDVVGAIRLAAAASTDCRTFRHVVDVLCSYAPPTPELDLGPTSLLVDAVRESKAEWQITNDESRIARKAKAE